MKLRGTSVFTGDIIEVELEVGVKVIESVATVQHDADSPSPLPYICPAFLDLQVNGLKGKDYSQDCFAADDIETIVLDLAQSGTTQHIPTLMTAPGKRLLRNLGLIGKRLDTAVDLQGAIAGIHLEGPYISNEDGPRGAHDSRYTKDPDFGEFLDWQEASGGRIIMMTLAPERKNAIDFIQRITDMGVIAAIGHTGADCDTITRAVAAGACVSTHLGNGSHARIPRLNNYIWQQLAEDELYAGIIADGDHLPPAVVKVVCRAKGIDRVFLVSDATPLSGCQAGRYDWGNIKVEVSPDGRLGLYGTPYLAGAGHLLDWDIAHIIRFTGYGLKEVIPMVTVNPALLLAANSGCRSLPPGYGRLEAGSPANLTLFHYREGEDRLDVIKTIREGTVVFSGATAT